MAEGQKKRKPYDLEQHGPYTRIANKLLDAWMSMDITGTEHKIIDAVIRKTYSYGLKEAPISLSLISKMTGIDKAQISRAIKSLLAKGVLIINQLQPVADSATKELSKQQPHQSAQVLAINADIAKLSKSQPVDDSSTIKEYVIFFKEKAEKGGFQAAFSASIKERFPHMPANDSYLNLLLECLDEIAKIYIPGAIELLVGTQAMRELEAIESKIDSIYATAKDRTECKKGNPFREMVFDYYRKWKATLSELKQSPGEPPDLPPAMPELS